MDQLPIAIIAIGLIAGMAVVLAAIVRVRFAVLIVTAMVLFASLAVQREEGRVSNSTFIQPIQLLRAELFFGSAIALLLVCAAHAPRLLRVVVLPAQAVIFLMIHLYAGIMLAIHTGSAAEGAKSAVFAVVTFVPLMLVVPVLLSDRRAWYTLLRAVVLAGAIWCALVFFQMGINRREMLVDFGRRLTGMHGQAQGASQYLCFVAIMSAWLVLNDPKRSLKLLWVGLAGVSLVLIAWTGSRSGAIMALIGLAFVLYARAGRAVLLLPIVGGVVMAVQSFIGGVTGNLGLRLLDVSDTRSAAWRQLFNQFLDDPFFGSGTQKVVENSYLLGLAAYGVLMGALLLLLLAVTGLLMWRLWMRRKALPTEFRQWVWLVLGINATYFIGANADGFILARLEATHVIILVFAGYGAALVRLAAGRGPLADGHAQPWDTSARQVDEGGSAGHATYEYAAAYDSNADSGEAALEPTDPDRSLRD